MIDGVSVAENFDRSVFINCPFDDDYRPILIAIIYCIVHCQFLPRLATERENSAEHRLTKIVSILNECRYSIHDISRCQCINAGDHYRLNMPLELGIDYGCRQFGAAHHRRKSFLILEEQRYRYQVALSDMAGSDIRAHAGDYQTAVRHVRNWLSNEAEQPLPAPQRIVNAYDDFQSHFMETMQEKGFSKVDITQIPFRELVNAMDRFVSARASAKP
jgi:hypothetical protein